jgi:hypothetical protein
MMSSHSDFSGHKAVALLKIGEAVGRAIEKCTEQEIKEVYFTMLRHIPREVINEFQKQDQ